MNAWWLSLILVWWSSSATPWSAVAPPVTRAIAEFEPADAVIIAWDESIAYVLAQITAAISQETLTYVVVPQEMHPAEVEYELTEFGVDLRHLVFIHEALDTPWIRDFGPIPIETSGTFAFVDNRYWDNRLRDDELPAVLARRFQVPLIRSELALDGGNLLSNGRGFCIVSTKILEENPELTDAGLSEVMHRCFGCEMLAILEPLLGEDTGHVDIFAKFVDEKTLLVGTYDDAIDPDNAQILDDNVALLRESARIGGASLVIHRMPMGSNDDGNFRTYLNALLVNNVLIMPVYPDEHEPELEFQALDVYRKNLPPGIDIRTVDVSGLMGLGGAVHCLTLAVNYVPVDPMSQRPERVPRRMVLNAARQINPNHRASYPIPSYPIH